jgi:DNA recombination-dependent growth factor C
MSIKKWNERCGWSHTLVFNVVEQAMSDENADLRAELARLEAELKERVTQIEASTGRKPGKKETRDIKEKSE